MLHEPILGAGEFAAVAGAGRLDGVGGVWLRLTRTRPGRELAVEQAPISGVPRERVGADRGCIEHFATGSGWVGWPRCRVSRLYEICTPTAGFLASP